MVKQIMEPQEVINSFYLYPNLFYIDVVIDISDNCYTSQEQYNSRIVQIQLFNFYNECLQVINPTNIYLIHILQSCQDIQKYRMSNNCVQLINMDNDETNKIQDHLNNLKFIQYSYEQRQLENREAKIEIDQQNKNQRQNKPNNQRQSKISKR